MQKLESMEKIEIKYRPDTLYDVIGNEYHMKDLIAIAENVKKIIVKIEDCMEQIELENTRIGALLTNGKEIPDAIYKNMDRLESEKERLQSKKIRHQILFGQSGVGKTTTPRAFANDIFGDDVLEMYDEYDASIHRDVAFYREVIANKAYEATGKYPFRIICLDECDLLGQESQWTLRGIIENSGCLFFLTCNYIENIYDSISGSRCTKRKMRPIPMDAAKKRMNNIAKLEGIDVEDEFLEELYLQSGGDLRACLGVLGEKGELGVKLTIKNLDVDKFDPHIFKTFVGKIRKSFTDANRFYKVLKIEHGLTPMDFKNAFNEWVIRVTGYSQLFKARLLKASQCIQKNDNDVLVFMGCYYDLYDEELQRVKKKKKKTSTNQPDGKNV